jgi:hypothetical protein
VAAVDHLKEGNLGISREIYVLSTIGNKLHQTPACHDMLYLRFRKKIWRKM